MEKEQDLNKDVKIFDEGWQDQSKSYVGKWADDECINDDHEILKTLDFDIVIWNWGNYCRIDKWEKKDEQEKICGSLQQVSGYRNSFESIHDQMLADFVVFCFALINCDDEDEQKVLHKKANTCLSNINVWVEEVKHEPKSSKSNQKCYKDV